MSRSPDAAFAFEGQYIVPNGMAYNSYVIMDEKIAVMDTVDARFTGEWLSNIREVLNGRRPDYLVVQHMEPDHSANIMNFIDEYPDAVVVGNARTFAIMDNGHGEYGAAQVRFRFLTASLGRV